MKITVLGCGNAFSAENFNQSFILEEEHEGTPRRMSIDCGYQWQAALAASKFKIKDIDDIYISHLHADHIGCLEYVAFSRYDWSKPFPQVATSFKHGVKPVRLYCEENLMKRLWNRSLRGGLESMEGFVATLDTFFDTRPVDCAKGFEWQGWKVGIIQQIHIMSGSQISLAFGTLFQKHGHKSVYFTTDAQHCSPNQVEVFYEKADIIFQDCETSPFLSNVHANYIQLAGYPDANATRLSDKIKAKMKLSHYQDFVSHNKKLVARNSPYSFYKGPENMEVGSTLIDFDWNAQAKIDGFDEFIKVGNVYDTAL